MPFLCFYSSLYISHSNSKRIVSNYNTFLFTVESENYKSNYSIINSTLENKASVGKLLVKNLKRDNLQWIKDEHRFLVYRILLPFGGAGLPFRMWLIFVTWLTNRMQWMWFLGLLMLDLSKPFRAPAWPSWIAGFSTRPLWNTHPKSSIIMLWGSVGHFGERSTWGRIKALNWQSEAVSNQQQHQFSLQEGSSSLRNGSSSLREVAPVMATWTRDSTAQPVGYWEQLVTVVVVD